MCRDCVSLVVGGVKVSMIAKLSVRMRDFYIKFFEYCCTSTQKLGCMIMLVFACI